MARKPSRPGRKATTNDARALLLTSLDERWKTYRAQVKTCRKEFSEEAVHDLRVAGRRLLAVLNFARALNPQPRIQTTRRFLKDQLDDLDDLRDVQVMLVQVAETLERVPSLKPFEVFLEERERRFLRLARKQTRALKTAELDNRIERIAEELKKRRVQQDFDARVLQVVDDIYLRTIQTFGQVDPSQTETIHRLRLAFKKFRYMAEIVYPIAPGYPASHLEGMHEYQSAMGDIQDMEIFLHMLNDFAENNVASFDPWPARRYFETRHSEAIASFLEDKGELHIFWRPAPDQPFPWENQHDSVHHSSRHRRRPGNGGDGGQPAPADQ